MDADQDHPVLLGGDTVCGNTYVVADNVSIQSQVTTTGNARLGSWYREWRYSLLHLHAVFADC